MGKGRRILRGAGGEAAWRDGAHFRLQYPGVKRPGPSTAAQVSRLDKNAFEFAFAQDDGSFNVEVLC